MCHTSSLLFLNLFLLGFFFYHRCYMAQKVDAHELHTLQKKSIVCLPVHFPPEKRDPKQVSSTSMAWLKYICHICNLATPAIADGSREELPRYEESRIFLTRGSNLVCCIAGRFFTVWPQEKPHELLRWLDIDTAVEEYTICVRANWTHQILYFGKCKYSHWSCEINGNAWSQQPIIPKMILA